MEAVAHAGDPSLAAELEFSKCLYYLITGQIDNFVDEIKTSDRDVNDLRSRYKQSLLHTVAYKGTVPAIEALLACGADVHAIDRANRTPLHYAIVGNQSVDVFYALLRAGCALREDETWTDGEWAHCEQGRTTYCTTLKAYMSAIMQEVDDGTPLYPDLLGIVESYLWKDPTAEMAREWPSNAN